MVTLTKEVVTFFRTTGFKILTEPMVWELWNFGKWKYLEASEKLKVSKAEHEKTSCTTKANKKVLRNFE